MAHSGDSGKPLAARVRATLTAVADPAAAPAMQAYMKSAMPYLGVSSVPRRKVLAGAFAGMDWPDSAAWRVDVLALWRGAAFREERYAAIELSGLKVARCFQTIDALPMYEEMIVTGAWWDYVDEIAGHRLWAILQNDRAAMAWAMREWSIAPDMWKRRSAILCQLRQARDRPRPALRLYRAVDSIGRIFPAEGDRLGAAPICLDRPRRGRSLRHRQRRPAERTEPARGTKERRQAARRLATIPRTVTPALCRGPPCSGREFKL